VRIVKEDDMRCLTFGLILATLLLSALLSGAHPSDARELILITEENPPYNFTQNGRLTGATTEVVREILRRQGRSDPIQSLPWARGYRQLQTKSNVVLFTTARTPERERQFHWIGPLYDFRLGFYARKGSGIRLSTLEDAKKVRAIATYKDDFREQLLRAMGFSNLDSSSLPHSNLKKLISGRVDLWFYDNIGASEVAAGIHVAPDAIEEVLPFRHYESFIAISMGTAPEVVSSWQTTLREMKADGSFWWIARKWLPSDAIQEKREESIAEEHGRLRLLTEDSPPSTTLKGGRLTGLSAEIVQEILRRLNHPARIEVVPWARGYKLALTRPNLGLFATTRLPQREDLFHWVGPLYTQTWGFFARKGSGIRVPTLEAARRVGRIGTYRQDAKMQYLESQGFSNLVPTNQNRNNITHLMRGDIDLWVSSDFNVRHLVRQAGFDPETVELAGSFREVSNYIAFSRSTSPHVVRLWRTVLEELKSDGSYDSICGRYEYSPP
jgi:polar amino acid transport system substrate-binding protein